MTQCQWCGGLVGVECHCPKGEVETPPQQPEPEPPDWLHIFELAHEYALACREEKKAIMRWHLHSLTTFPKDIAKEPLYIEWAKKQRGAQAAYEAWNKEAPEETA